jgi:Zn-finger nucleic acid-binding protein
MMWRNEKFCPSCGAVGTPIAVGKASQNRCPRCRVQLTVIAFSRAGAEQCTTCSGLWFVPEDFEQLCAEADERAVDGGARPQMPKLAPEPGEMYPPCAQCNQRMTRQNFAPNSGVILNRCRPHGVWLDKGELRQVVDFILAGGLIRGRKAERAKLDEARRRLESEKRTTMLNDPPPGRGLLGDFFGPDI